MLLVLSKAINIENWKCTIAIIRISVYNILNTQQKIDNRIDGVVRFGRSWAIPKNAQKPSDKRVKRKGNDDE